MKPVSTSTMLSPRRARMNENGRSITPSVVHAADQVDPRLVLAPRILDDEDLPVVVLGHGDPLTFSRRPAEAREPDGDDQDGALHTYCEKVGAPKMLSPLKPTAMISAPMKVPRTWNSPSRNVAEPRKTAANAVSR